MAYCQCIAVNILDIVSCFCKKASAKTCNVAVPLHTDVDLSSVVALWQQEAIHQDGPLDGHGC